MWAWIIVIAIWSVLGACLAHYVFDSEVLFNLFMLLFVGALILGALFATVEFLRVFEAWPFTPQ